MELKEWIARYNAKVPEPFQRDERYGFYFKPDRGFCEIGQTENMIIINQLGGDARFWKDAVDSLARKMGIKHCGTWCIREGIRAYIRLFGYRIIKEDKLEGGLSRFHCLHKERNTKGLVSPCFRYQSGVQAYFITWEP